MKKILITMLLLSAFIIVSCDGGTKKDTDKDLGISDTDVITDQEVTNQDSPVPDECKNREVRNCVDFESFERCVDGSWETISLKHKGLEWSCINHWCGGDESSLPTIQELRTLVQNCPEVEYPKPEGQDPWCESESYCAGCGYDKSVEHSVFLDTEKLLSSTYTKPSVCLSFGNAGIDICYETEKDYKTRCVRRGEEPGI